MFEHGRTHFTPAEGSDTGPQGLRAIAWPTLVARLAAQRDLHQVMRARQAPRRASFDGGTAAWLGLSLRPMDRDEAPGKPDVNPDTLTDGNQAGAIDAEAASGAAEGDREIL